MFTGSLPPSNGIVNAPVAAVEVAAVLSRDHKAQSSDGSCRCVNHLSSSRQMLELLHKEEFTQLASGRRLQCTRCNCGKRKEARELFKMNN